MKKITEDFIASISRKDLLALDIATKTGYYNVYEHGMVKFPNNESAPKSLGENYAQHKAFREWLISMIEKHHVKVIVAEDLLITKFFHDSSKLGAFHGIFNEVCETMNVPYVKISPSSLKKFATDNGRADKKMMMESCRKRWKIEPVDDNEADAAHLFFYFCNRYKL